MPIAPHVFYLRILNDDNPEEREQGIELGLELMKCCQEMWICGDRISEGMEREIKEAERLDMKIVYK